MANSSTWQRPPQFDGKNYDVWSIKMKTILCSQELWELVEGGFVDITDPTTFNTFTQAQRNQLKENRKKDAKALSYIQMALSDSIFPRIAAATNSKQAWDILQNAFQGSAKVKLVKLQLLRRDFETLQMKESESVNDFLTRTMSIVNQIKTNGDTIEDHRIVEKVLRSLPARYDPVVIAIEESKDLTQMTVDELMGSLQTHEQRMNRSSTSSLEQAFKSQVLVRGRGRGACNRGRRGRFNSNQEERRNYSKTQGRGRGSSTSRGGSSQRYNKSNIQCYYCKKYAHYASECRKKEYDMNKQNANLSKAKELENEKGENLFITCNIAEQRSDEVWYLDSGCSNHMSGWK
eukprot:Gb_35303 [translate_table: standard]